jgi:hypothetical protein
MVPSMRRVACATILAAACSAQAQPPSGNLAPPPGMATPPAATNPQHKAGPDPHPQVGPTTAPGAMPGDPKGTADAAYRAAEKTCDARTGADKAACLKDARVAYDSALARKDAAPTTAPSGNPAAPGTNAPADTKQK